jgi:hypothetical protein
MLRSSSTKAIVGMSLLSAFRLDRGLNGEQSSGAPRTWVPKWRSNLVTEQCKLG